MRQSDVGTAFAVASRPCPLACPLPAAGGTSHFYANEPFNPLVHLVGLAVETGILTVDHPHNLVQPVFQPNYPLTQLIHHSIDLVKTRNHLLSQPVEIAID